MDGVVIHAIAVGIVLIGAGRTNNVVEYPCAVVVGLDGRLHVQHAAQHVTQVSIKTLHIFTGVRHGHVVLVGV